MSIVDSQGNPVAPQLNQQQVMQLMTGLRIRIDAANAQLVQLGLLVEYLYETLEKQGVNIAMEEFPTWAEKRYEEIQAQAQEAIKNNEGWADGLKQKVKDDLKGAGVDLGDEFEEALSKVTENLVATADTETDIQTESTNTDTTDSDTTENTDTQN